MREPKKTTADEINRGKDAAINAIDTIATDECQQAIAASAILSYLKNDPDNFISNEDADLLLGKINDMAGGDASLSLLGLMLRGLICPSLEDGEVTWGPTTEMRNILPSLSPSPTEVVTEKSGGAA